MDNKDKILIAYAPNPVVFSLHYNFDIKWGERLKYDIERIEGLEKNMFLPYDLHRYEVQFTIGAL